MSQERKIWKTLDDRLLHKTRVFDLRVKRMRSPDESYEDDFFYVDTADWVNIIPITPDNQVVLVRQYRHGVNEMTLETPGGMVDHSDSPLETAIRELREETGYVPAAVFPLGVMRPNPAMLTNRCHVFAATGVVREAKQELDPSEVITVQLFALADIPQLIVRGEISHSIVAGAFFLLWTSRPDLVPR